MNNDVNCLSSYVSLNIPSQDVCSGQPACGGGITNNKKRRGGDFFCCFHLFLLLFSIISFVVFNNLILKPFDLIRNTHFI